MANHSQLDQWHGSVRKSIVRPALIGLSFVLIGGGAFGAWAMTAPIASGTVALGTFVAAGTNKTVQHLEGGVIQQILVKEGDKVDAGQVLVRLSGTFVASELRRFQLRQFELTATSARLQAELGFSKTFEWSHPDVNTDDEFQGIVREQKKVFDANSRDHAKLRAILRSRVKSIQDEIDGLKGQKEAKIGQSELMKIEVRKAETAYRQGFLPEPLLNQKKRASLQLEGEIAQLHADASKSAQKILETELEILRLDTERHKKLAEESRTTRSELDDVEQRIRATLDVQSRLQVVAPVPGTIVKLNYHTSGGVIAQGGEILELLPSNDKLVVEAYVRPEDKDSVTSGMEVELRLTSLSARTTPTLSGDVIYVSADTIDGKSPGEVYYVARVRIHEDELANLGEAKITPGMPAEVFIRSDERTLMEYIVRPILDSFARSFRET